MPGAGAKQNPWTLKTPPGTAEFQAYKDPTADPPALVVQVGKTQLRYHLRCLEDLHAMLKGRGDCMLLGSADEQKPAAEDTVEGVGPLGVESRGRLVRTQEGPSRPLRHVRSAGYERAWFGRSRGHPAEQPDACEVGSVPGDGHGMPTGRVFHEDTMSRPDSECSHDNNRMMGSKETSKVRVAHDSPPTSEQSLWQRRKCNNDLCLDCPDRVRSLA